MEQIWDSTTIKVLYFLLSIFRFFKLFQDIDYGITMNKYNILKEYQKVENYMNQYILKQAQETFRCDWLLLLQSLGRVKRMKRCERHVKFVRCGCFVSNTLLNSGWGVLSRSKKSFQKVHPHHVSKRTISWDAIASKKVNIYLNFIMLSSDS